MTQTRLHLIAPDLEQAIGADGARQIALLAVRAALAAYPTDSQDVHEALLAMDAGDWKKARRHRSAVQAAVDRLDETYFDLFQAAGEVHTPSVEAAFSRTRAVAAMFEALGSNETIAAKEALYEAHSTLGDDAGEDLLATVRRRLAAR